MQLYIIFVLSIRAFLLLYPLIYKVFPVIFLIYETNTKTNVYLPYCRLFAIFIFIPNYSDLLLLSGGLMIKYSFSPLIAHSSKILILGSLPGEESLRKEQYYAYPRNAFWKIMFAIFNEDFSEDYSVRCGLLLKNRIALWDTVHSGNREGSLDSAIKNEVPNNVEKLLNEYRNISKILLNGKKAEATYNKYFRHLPVNTLTLPSTSPANAGVSFEEKFKLWEKAVFPFKET